MSKMDICLITGTPPTNILIEKLISVLRPIVTKMVVITGNMADDNSLDINTKIVNVGWEHPKGLLFTLVNNIFLQLRYSYHILVKARKIKTIIYFLGGSAFPLPIIISRFMRKRIYLIVTHSTSQIAKRIYPNFAISLITRSLERLNYYLCHQLIVYSPNMTKDMGLELYRNKTVIAYEHFVDFSLFYKNKEVTQRKYSVGFVGRLSEEKGIFNLLNAMLLLPPELNLIVCGDGGLRGSVEEYIQANRLNDRVKLTGWIDNKCLPHFLNDMKILIIPSYTEGLANIMYEAMACGTPVLASPVGAIPDFVRNGETGFLLKSNKPEDIASGLLKALNSPKLQEIVYNSIALTHEFFSIEKAIERYRSVLENNHGD